MKTICFYFQIHQPFRLKRYRFFDIGKDHYYYDDFNNENIIRRIVDRSFIPANQLMLDMIKASEGKFKIALSISGIALEQLQVYAPEVIDGFKELAKTGCVEFLGETYAHSLASLKDQEEFIEQVKQHATTIQELFGQTPKVFRNTELIYSDDIGSVISSLGYKGMITEGAKHLLGWKSPNYLYASASNPELKLLLRNYKLSDDMAFRFSNTQWNEFPLTADKFIRWIAATPESEQVVNLFMNYETFGELQSRESGIFEFMKALPRFAAESNISFSTPSEVVGKLKSVAEIPVPYPVSWADEERDTTNWLGNQLQTAACSKLYGISERVRLIEERRIKQDWMYLQSSDHFYYMSTKHSSDGSLRNFFSPYENPYDAFTNYMNVLGDFISRVEAQYPTSIENDELNSLLSTIKNQGDEIISLEKEIKKMKSSKNKKEVTKKS